MYRGDKKLAEPRFRVQAIHALHAALPGRMDRLVRHVISKLLPLVEFSGDALHEIDEVKWKVEALHQLSGLPVVVACVVQMPLGRPLLAVTPHHQRKDSQLVGAAVRRGQDHSDERRRNR